MKRRREGAALHSPFTVLIYSFGVGALVLLPFQLATPQPWPVAVPTLLWFAEFIGLSTIAGFSIYTFALGRLQASVAAIAIHSLKPR